MPTTVFVDIYGNIKAKHSFCCIWQICNQTNEWDCEVFAYIWFKIVSDIVYWCLLAQRLASCTLVKEVTGSIPGVPANM